MSQEVWLIGFRCRLDEVNEAFGDHGDEFTRVRFALLQPLLDKLVDLAVQAVRHALPLCLVSTPMPWWLIFLGVQREDAHQN